MRQSTYLKIFHNWKRGKDTVLSKYKYNILFAPLLGEYYIIRASKNGEDWCWHEPCPYYICMLIDPLDPLRDWGSLHPNTIVTEKIADEGYTTMFKEENAE